MSKSERLDVLMLRVAPLNENKPGGRLTDRNTLKSYKTNILKFCEWSKALGISREHQIAKNGYSPQTLIQKYTDELVDKGLSAATIHTYLAPVCKGLGIGMEQIRKPKRRSADISKNTKLNQNAAGARQAEDPRYARILRLAEIVTVRPRALARLTAQNLQQDENGDYIIAIRDKGGKESIQLLLPHEVEFVRDILSTDADGRKLKPDEHPFSYKDLGQIAYSRYRILRAQHIQAYFEQRFTGWEGMPCRTEKQRQARAAAKEAAMAEKQQWINKIVAKYAEAHPKESADKIARYRRELSRESKISIREGNRERAIALGRPTEYDRVSVRIASIYALSHWVDETTIRNYLTK